MEGSTSAARLQEPHGLLGLPPLAFQVMWDALSTPDKLALIRTSHSVRKLASDTIKSIRLHITRSALESKSSAKMKRLPRGTKLEEIVFCPKGKKKAGQTPENDEHLLETSLAACLASGGTGSPWSGAHTATMESLPVCMTALPWLGLAMPTLKTLRLHACTVDDLALAGLLACKQLTCLSLQSITWRVTGGQNSPVKGSQVQSLAMLGGLPNLQMLRLENMKVPFLEFLGSLGSLTHFTAKGCYLAMSGKRTPFSWEELFAALPAIPTLTYLHLEGKEHAPLRPVENLLLSDCSVAAPQMTLPAVQSLLKACPKLQHLHLGPRTPLTVDSFTHLVTIPTLNVLSVADVVGLLARPPGIHNYERVLRSSGGLQHLTLYKPSLEALAWVPLLITTADLHLGTVPVWSTDVTGPCKLAAEALTKYGSCRTQYGANLLGGQQPIKAFLPPGSHHVTHLAPVELHLLCQPVPYRALCRQAVSAVVDQMQQEIQAMQAAQHEVGALLNNLLPRLLVGLRDSMTNSGASTVARTHEAAQLQVLAPLAGQLRKLHLSHFQVTGAHVEAINTVVQHSLEVLSLQDCTLDDTTWHALHQHMPNLQCLMLAAGCKGKAMTALNMGMFMATMTSSLVVQMDSNLWESDKDITQLKEVLRNWPSAALLKLVDPVPVIQEKSDVDLPFEVRVTFQPMFPGGAAAAAAAAAAGAQAGAAAAAAGAAGGAAAGGAGAGAGAGAAGAVVDIVVNAGVAPAGQAAQNAAAP